MTIERISRKPPEVGGWQYVVRMPGQALDLRVRRRRDTGSLHLVTAVLHRLVPAALVAESDGDIADDHCELVGGACEVYGGMLAAEVEAMFERQAARIAVWTSNDERAFAQPEAFWLALEALLREPKHRA